MKVHQDTELLEEGSLDSGKTVILLHGRGATAGGIIQLAERLPEAKYYAPQASNREWYPHSFLKPREKNQPHLDSALERIDSLVEKISEEVPSSKIVVAGFSQGACLASEYSASNPDKVDGVIAFSGGLIGDKIGEFEGEIDGEVFLGCAEKDPHIPKSRVDETEEVFKDLGADVEKYIFEGSHHGIDDYEIEKASDLIATL